MDEVSYCELVEYKFQEKEIRGGKGFVFLPGEGRMTPSQINQQKTLAWDYEMKKGKNNFQKFIHDHQRFDYIFGNNVGSPLRYAHLYPDTAKINQLICSDLKQDNNFNRYFRLLSNIDISQKEIFTWKEMMHVSSRFFLTWQSSDSTLSGYICITFNGTKELKLKKDLTVLEALAFEGIFHHLRREKNPAFVRNFSKYRNHFILIEKDKHPVFEDFFITVKNKTYEAMEKDAELKKALKNYYDSQKQTLGFIIK